MEQPQGVAGTSTGRLIAAPVALITGTEMVLVVECWHAAGVASAMEHCQVVAGGLVATSLS
jgi:hypothetical protein